MASSSERFNSAKLASAADGRTTISASNDGTPPTDTSRGRHCGSRTMDSRASRKRRRTRLREALLSIVRDPQWRARLTSVGGVPSFDALIVVRPSAADATFAELKRSLELAMERGKLA